MSVMNRPLFRAAGGGASKFPDLSGDGKVTQKDILIGRGVIEKQEGGGIGSMMPAEDMAMMPQEGLDPLAQDVLMAREQGEAIGLDYLAETMDGIDMASNTEELINSIRGNDRPLQERVAELATYVGEQDAMQTPESVLTMVQPTIMLTEEGAVDSGVGGLMQQVLGETEMNDEMGQGVGALMAQGQPEPMDQPVQQFNQGGAVKKFQTGTSPLGTRFPNTDPAFDPLRGTVMARSQIIGDAEQAGRGLTSIPGLEDLVGPEYFRVLQDRAFTERAPRSAEEAAAEYRKLMEEAYDVEGARAASDREAALDLARAGFAFASGRDPRTGENMAGRGFLAQLGSVGQQYAESASERLARERKGEQAIRLAAVQQGIEAEERDRAESERRASEAFGGILQAGIDQRRLQQEGKLTQAKLTSAGQQLAATLGFNALDADLNRQHQTDLTEQKGDIDKEIRRLQSNLDESRAQNDFGRSKELTGLLHDNKLEIIDIEFDQNLALQADRFRRDKDNQLAFINLRGAIETARDKQRQDHATFLQDDRQDFTGDQAQLDRDLREDLTEAELDLRKDLAEQRIALAEEEFALREGLAPSTTDSVLFDLTGGMFGQSSQARDLNQVRLEIEQLKRDALAQGIDQTFLSRMDQDLANYINLADLTLRQERQTLAKSEALLGRLTQLGAAPKVGTSAQQNQLLSNRDAIRAYAQGLDIPGFDLALSQQFGTVTLDNRGNEIPARKLTPPLRAAIIKRKEAGIAVPDLPGFALGGEVDMGAGQGLLDPVTGYRFPMTTPVQEPEQLPRTYEPIISKDIEDITKATGTREAIKVGFGNVANTVANVIFGTEFGVGADERQAKKAVETLGTVATTTLMAAIPGKDNVELQRMLKNLQVPADSLVLQDEEALDYFKLAKNTMALGIQNQEDLLDNANLTRKEITKVQTDLAQMNSIQAEYDNIIKAYEAKLKPSQQVFDELDKFFK
jgi:hypothetical protein